MKKKFATATLDLTKNAFVVYLNYFNKKILIYLAWQTKIALLLAKKVTVPAKYLDFADGFLKKSAIEFFKHSNINKYVIDLELGK